MSKFENLTAKADARLVATDVAATVATYASVTEMRVTLAPVWAALTLTTDKDSRKSLANLGEDYNEAKPTIDRYVRLGLVLLALDKVSDKQREEIHALVNASAADRGRIASDTIKAVANEATSASDAIARLKAAADEAKAAKDEADAAKAKAKADEEADAAAIEAETPDEAVIAGFAGTVAALVDRMNTMGPDNVDALAALVDVLAASVAARIAEFDALVSVA